jgi:hypothetical protein
VSEVEPKPVTGEWVTVEEAPQPEPVELDVHRFEHGDVEKDDAADVTTDDEPSNADD